MLLKLVCIVSLLVFLAGTRVDAACGTTLSTYLTRSDIASNSTLEYLYVSSPYSVSAVSGNEFAVIWNGTDAGEVENFMMAGQSANITLIDSTATTGTLSPRPPRKVISTADRSTVGQTINVLALVLSLGGIQYLRKGFAPLFVVIIALSMANLISSTVFSDAPCKDATVTLQIPEATIRFICVNNEPCVCGPGYTGDDCVLGSAPVATPISNPPVATTPVAAPVSPPTNSPITPPISSPVSSPVTPPVAQPTCTDDMQNGVETDVDCGGGTCPKCSPEYQCGMDSDCDSDVCLLEVCQYPSCDDSKKNGLETDTDCGGSGECPRCLPGDTCNDPSDCNSDVCTNHICQQATCSDNVVNGDESDVDCGGTKCNKCAVNKHCNMNGDCASGLSCDGESGLCIDACTDGFKNNQETDTDCGGSTCAKCIDGKDCIVNSDCSSTYCDSSNQCAPPVPPP